MIGTESKLETVFESEPKGYTMETENGRSVTFRVSDFDGYHPGLIEFAMASLAKWWNADDVRFTTVPIY